MVVLNSASLLLGMKGMSFFFMWMKINNSSNTFSSFFKTLSFAKIHRRSGKKRPWKQFPLTLTSRLNGWFSIFTLHLVWYFSSLQVSHYRHQSSMHGMDFSLKLISYMCAQKHTYSIAACSLRLLCRKFPAALKYYYILSYSLIFVIT